MPQIREYRSNLKMYIGRVSHDFPANVAYFHFHSYDSRATVLRNILAKTLA